MPEPANLPKSSPSETYRYVISLNRKRLFLLSLSTVFMVMIVFFLGYLTGNTLEEPAEQEQVVLPEPSPILNTEELTTPNKVSSQSTVHAKTNADGFNQLFPSGASVNETSDFNTNDLVFEDIFSDKEVSQALADGAQAEDNDSYNRSAKRPNSTERPNTTKRPNQASSKPTHPNPAALSKQTSVGTTKSTTNGTTKKRITKGVTSNATKIRDNKSVKINQSLTAKKAPPQAATPRKASISQNNSKQVQKAKRTQRPRRARATVYEEYPETGKTYYYLQLMTTGEIVKGRRFSAKLRDEGFAVKLAETVISDGVYYAILIGLYKNKLQAREHLNRFKTAPRYGSAFKDAFIRPYNVTNNALEPSASDVLNTSPINTSSGNTTEKAIFTNSAANTATNSPANTTAHSPANVAGNATTRPPDNTSINATEPSSLEDSFEDPSF